MRKYWYESDAVLENQRNLVVELRDQIETLTNTLHTTHHENKHALLEIDELQNRCEDEKVETEALVYSHKASESILKDVELEYKDIREQLRKEREYSQLSKRDKEALSDENTEIDREIKTQSEAVNYLKELQQQLIEENQNLKNMIIETQEETANILNSKSKHRAQLLDAKLQLESAQYKYSQLDLLNDSKDYQNLKLAYKIDPKKTYGVPREIKLETKVQKYKALLETEEQRAQVFTADVRRYKNMIQTLRTEIAEVKDELSTIKKKIRQAKDPRRRLTDRLIATSLKKTKVK